MAKERLPWMPLYVRDLLASTRFKNLSGDQMAAYLWFLMIQWEDESLPFDILEMSNSLPRGIHDSAYAYALTTFFPPDPDTNRRRNPKLAAIREEQVALLLKKRAQTAAATAAREVRHVTNDVTSNVTTNVTSGKGRGRNNVNEVPTTATTGLSVQVETALEPYLRSHRYPGAARASVRGLLNPESSPSYPEAVVVQALTEMAAEGRPFKATTLAAWCANLTQQAREGPPAPRGRPNGGRVGSGRLSFLDALPPAPEEP